MGKFFSKYLIYLSLILIMQLVLAPVLFAQQAKLPGFYGSASNLPEVASNALPKIKTDGLIQGVAGLSTPQTNQLIVHQNQSKAIIDWESFNIGKDAWTHFDQKGNTDWAALNRIYDQNPSLIFGKLTADGKIYLINQNGTLFGPSANVNVHTLVASSLDMGQEEFLENRLKFNGLETAGKVINQGQLVTESGGSIFLIAPEVENGGTIITPAGQSGLIAATDVEIKTPENENRLFPFVYINQTGDKGTAVNLKEGSITAEAGLAGLYGRVVNQEGVIKSITAISNNGRIELHASETIETGEDSLTASPISDSSEAVHQSFNIQGGQIHIAGLDREDDGNNSVSETERIVHKGDIISPSGKVELLAQERVYLEKESRIDVSGEWVVGDDSANIIEVQLNSVELKDAFGQKDGILQGETVSVNPQSGSTIGDLTGALNFEFRTAREASTNGGDITISAPEGDIIIRQDANIDFSGGGRIINSRLADTAKIISGNRVYDISNAPQWIAYDNILNEQTQINERFGIIDTFLGIYAGGASPISNRVSSYVEGDDAGSLTLNARGVVLDGSISGSATRGIFQTEMIVSEMMVGNFAIQLNRGTRAPRGGQLIIGGSGESVPGLGNNLTMDEVVVVGDSISLLDSFEATDSFVDIIVEGNVPKLFPLTVSGETPFVSEFKEIRYWNVTDERFVTRTEFENPGADHIVMIDDYPLFLTTLSASKLSAAGLSDLTITANTKVCIEQGASIELEPGGLRINEAVEFRQGVPLQYLDTLPATLNIQARAIEHAGNIRIPSAGVTLSITDTITSPFVIYPSEETVIPDQLLPHRIFLANGSRIDVSGDIILNNLLSIGDSIDYGLIDGGSVSLMDITTGEASGSIIINHRANIDVSSGYEINPSSKFEFGNAGSLLVKANTIILDGELNGYSFIGTDGGEISLHADNLEVRRPEDIPKLTENISFDTDLPEDMIGKLFLADNRLDETGFAAIELISSGSLELLPDTHLRPSEVKLNPKGYYINPKVTKSYDNLVRQSTKTIPIDDERLTVPLEFLGDTSIALKSSLSRAGEGTAPSNTSSVRLNNGAMVEVAPKGSITLSGQNIDVDGILIAPGGSVDIEAKGDFLPESHELRLRSNTRIFAGGTYIQQDEAVSAYVPLDIETIDGGSVTLAGANNLFIEKGAVIDVSGSLPVTRYIRQSIDSIVPVIDAGAAGRISLTFTRDFEQNGEMIGSSYLPTVKKGGFTIISKDARSDSQLTIEEDIFKKLKEFDDLAFVSLRKIVFSETNGDGDTIFDVEVGGNIELNSPLLTAVFEDNTEFQQQPELRLSGNLIVLSNNNSKYSGTGLSPYGTSDRSQNDLVISDARFVGSADWIDIRGDIAFSGFENVALTSAADMRLSDEKYDALEGGTARTVWSGELISSGDLYLEADRIYPTTRSDFSITTASENSRITLERPKGSIDNLGPIYSAGGSLTIAANEIDHRGFVAAPMGRITFTGTDQPTIVFSSRSVTTTRGEIPVLYGNLADVFWTTQTKSKEPQLPSSIITNDVEQTPEKSILVQANGIIIKNGAMIDASGGGEIFAFEFTPSVEGLVDPFQKDNRYVVVPGISSPGKSIVLTQSVNGLPAGAYSLLPQECAFVPGAYVVEDLGETIQPLGNQLSAEGYSVAIGFETEFGRNIRSSVPSLFSVRPARDVFAEGKYNIRSLTSGEGGRVSILGNTTILDGTVKGGSLTEFEGGTFSVSGTASAVIRFGESLPNTVDTFDEIVQFLSTESALTNLVGNANVRADGLSNKGLMGIQIGTLDKNNPTETVTVESQAELETPIITLAGTKSITLESDSSILALGPGGTANLLSPVINLEERSLIRASDVVSLETDVNPEVSPKLKIDGQVQVDSSLLSLTADRIVVVPDGASSDSTGVLELEESLAGFVGFDRIQLNALSSLSFKGNVTFDVEQQLDIITPYIIGELPNNGSVSVNSKVISLQSNQTGQSNVDNALGINASITFSADEVNIGPGNLAVNGFDSISINSINDLSLIGEGALLTNVDLNLNASRITTAPFILESDDGSLEYQVARYTLQAGQVAIGSSKGMAGQTRYPGGKLQIVSDDVIRVSGLIEMFSGQIEMQAQNGIILGENARIWSQGGVLESDFEGEKLIQFHRGGSITLYADSGDIDINTSAELDVSNFATEGMLAYVDVEARGSLPDSGLMDAGTISLSAKSGKVYPFGSMKGGATVGRGGNFTLNTQTMVDVDGAGEFSAFSSLNTDLAEGGFDGALDIHTRSGSIYILEDDSVTFRRIKLTADTGGIDILGTLDASGGDRGGCIELFAGGIIGGIPQDDISIMLGSTSTIVAKGNTGDGGEVLVSAADGFIQFDPEASMDVSGGSGGEVHFRAKRIDGLETQVNMRLFGNINGAAGVIAEGVVDFTGQLSGSQFSSGSISIAFMPNSVFSINSNSFSAEIAENPNFNFMPGFEALIAGDLTFADDIDLTGTRYSWRYINETGEQTAESDQIPGVLTLRATGGITLNGSLVDHPTFRNDLNIDEYNRFEEKRTWSYNLVSGGDLSSAEPMRTAFGADTGYMNIGDNLIYTENGLLQFASGSDVVIGNINSSNRFMINSGIGYNLATFAGDIRGTIRKDLILDGGAIQSALGDIEIEIGNDLNLDLASGSAIRTTGIGSLDIGFPEYSNFSNGGAIALYISGNLNSGGGNLQFFNSPSAGQSTRHLLYWDSIYDDSFLTQSWSADYGYRPGGRIASTPTAGVATMAGGDLRIIAGGDMNGQFGTFKDGDVAIVANGDIDGFLQISDGTGFIDVMGNVLSNADNYDTSLAMFHAQIGITAQGSIAMGTVFNPTFPETFNEYTDYEKTPFANLTYSGGVDSPNTSVKLATSMGDVELTGFFKDDVGTPNTYRVLPSVFEIESGNDIRFNSLVDFALAPSTTGNLRLVSSGGSITGLKQSRDDVNRPTLYISDLDPADVYFSLGQGLNLKGLKTPGDLVFPPGKLIDFFVSPAIESSHANIHVEDLFPIELIADKNIEELVVYSPKAAKIQAGEDIQGLHFIGQHLNSTDLTTIRAKGNISLASVVINVASTSDPRIESTGFIFNGPGNFIVQAGESIDLGISKGIQATGNSFNLSLKVADIEETKSALLVVAGLYQNISDETIKLFPEEAEQFFYELLENGKLFSESKEAGELDQAVEIAQRTERDVIDPFFNNGVRGEGNIFMTSSQISSSGKTSKALRPFNENMPELLAEYEESSDIFIIASGDANVGLTAIPDPETTDQETNSGIFTSEGGAISIFTLGDLNVNESRVMTFRGGDILAYSGLGDINAGRGSKTAINAGSPKVVNLLDDDGNIVGKKLEFKPPSVGSGIRTLTYDPDGTLGSDIAPLAGDGFLFAPQGVIDAGEAGIGARNIILGATEVLNAENISFSIGSVGVPLDSEGANLGALSGAAAALGETSKITEDSAAMKSAQERMDEYTKTLSETLVPKWIAVEVIGFDETDGGKKEESEN